MTSYMEYWPSLLHMSTTVTSIYGSEHQIKYMGFGECIGEYAGDEPKNTGQALDPA